MTQRDLDRRVALLSLAIWAFHTAHVATVAVILERPTNDIGSQVARLATFGTALAITAVIWLFARRMSPVLGLLRVFLRVAAMCLAGCAVLTLCNETYFRLWSSAYHLSPEWYLHPAELIATYLGLLWIFLTWAGLYVTTVGAHNLAAQTAQNAAILAASQQAQLAALKNQLQPHFLFNALNAVSALVHDGRYAQAEQTLLQLGGFLSHSITLAPHEFGTLHEEVESEKLYLAVEQIRFPDRLKLTFRLDEAVLESMVPSLILQPLIENAIKHGLARSLEPVTIEIGARKVDENVHIWVADDACPIREYQGGLGVGLRNVRERLQILYGPAARLVCSQTSPGWRSEVIIPGPDQTP